MMLRRTLAAGLMAGLAVATFSSCGNSGPTFTAIQHGALYTFLSDAPAPDVLSFRVTITTMKLRVAGTKNTVTVFPSNAEPLGQKKLELCSLRDASTIIDLSSVPRETYDQVSISISIAQMTLYDPTSDPPVKKLTAKLSTTTPSVAILPALSLVANQVNALQLDFDMLRSIEVDANGQVTGNVTPVFKATPVMAVGTAGFGEFDDLVGFVRTVQPSSTVQNFIGSLTLQLLSGSGPAITINFDSATQLYGVAGLNVLETGRVTEVDASVDKNGNFIAHTVDVQDRAIVENNALAFLGLVTSLTRDAGGNVTQFDLYIREEEPDVSSTVPLDTVVSVSVPPATKLQYSSRPTNFVDPPLPFDAKAIAVGQELIVNGTYAKASDQPTTVAPTMIVLKLQTMQGNLGSIVQIGDDGHSGAFWLTPQPAILAGSPILVLTSANTTYLNLLGLADIIPQATLLIRGLPFYQADATTINGVFVPAGTLVVLARQVHQLD